MLQSASEHSGSTASQPVRLGMDQVEACLSLAAAKCAESEGGQGQLLRLFLATLQSALGANCVRVWEYEAETCQLVLQIPLEAGPQDASLSQITELSLRALEQQVLRAAVQVVQEGRVVSEERDIRTGVCSLWLGAELAGRVVLVAEFSGGSVLPTVDEGLCEVLADLRRREQTLEYRQVRLVQRGRELLLERLHSVETTGDLEQIAGTEFASVFRCRRIVVCRRPPGGGRWQAVATAGGMDINRRSEASAAIERMVQEVARSAEGDSGAVGVAVQPAGQLVLPVTVSGTWAGAVRALYVEHSTDAHLDTAGLQQAVRNLARAVERIEGSGAQAAGGRLRKLRWLLASPCLLILLLPQELRIAVEGELQPVLRQSVFAPDSGIIDAVSGSEGRVVAAGDFLLQLRSDELQLETERNLGDLAAAQARLAAIESLRAAGDTPDSGLLNAEQAELTVLVQSLQQQRQILSQRVAGLMVRSPIAGRLIGSEFTERLQGRPVQRGQRLCEIVHSDGDWQLQLWVAERDVGHVASAWRGPPEGRRLSFLLESDPGQTWQAIGGELAGAVELGPRGDLQTELTVPLTGTNWQQVRPGAGVKAVILCGRHTAGYVWFRRLIEAVSGALAF